MVSVTRASMSGDTHLPSLSQCRLLLQSALRMKPPLVGKACRQWGDFEIRYLRTKAVLSRLTVTRGTQKSLWTRDSVPGAPLWVSLCARWPWGSWSVRWGWVESGYPLQAVLSPRLSLGAHTPSGANCQWGQAPGVGSGGLFPVSFPSQFATTLLRASPLGGP